MALAVGVRNRLIQSSCGILPESPLLFQYIPMKATYLLHEAKTRATRQIDKVNDVMNELFAASTEYRVGVQQKGEAE